MYDFRIFRGQTAYLFGLSPTKHRWTFFGLALFSLSLPGISSAQIFYNWNTTGGDYLTATNWSPSTGAPPDTAFEGALFDVPDSYVVSVNSNVSAGSASFLQGQVTLDLLFGSYSVGGLSMAPLAGNSNTLSILEGTINSSVTTIGVNDGGDANLRILPTGDWSDSGHTTLGDAGSGSLFLDADGFGSTCGPFNLPCNVVLRGQATSNSTTLGLNATGTGDATVIGNWTTGDLTIGDAGIGSIQTSSTLFTGVTGFVTVNGTINSQNVTMAVQAGSQGSSTIPAGQWTVDGQARIGISGAASVSNTGTWNTLADVTVAENSSSNTTITLSGGDWNASQSVYLGGTSTSAGGTGTLNLDGGSMTVANTLKIWKNFDATVGGGTLSAPSISVEGNLSVTGGTVDLSDSNLTIQNAGLVDGTLTTNDNTMITVTDSGVLAIPENLPGTMTVNSGGVIDLERLVATQGSTVFVASDGELRVDQIVSAPDNLTLLGRLTIDRDLRITNDFAASLASIVGRGTIAAGGQMIIEGDVVVDGYSFATAPGEFFQIDSGGSMTVVDGNVFQTGPVIVHAGAKLELTSTTSSPAPTTIGDPAAPNGFSSAGTIHAGANSLFLADANDAVIDSTGLLTIGSGAAAGSVTTSNGLTLDFGANLTGFGTVFTPNNLAAPLINNGHIAGDSPTQPITLTGYVKGVGTCDNCNIVGTDAPGFSPATVNRGSVNYNGTLEIEIAGTGEGSFDKLNHILGAGIADLGGVLDVSLLGGFAPSAGDTFEIITAASVLDTFDIINLPPLAGLTWNIDYTPTSVVLSLAASAILFGDADNDLAVSGSDLLAVTNNFGNTGPADGLLLGDADDNGSVSGSDLLAVTNNFGATLPGSLASAAVPEPRAAVVLLLGTALLSFRCRTQQRKG